MSVAPIATKSPSKHLFRTFWKLAKPFWSSSEQWRAIGLLLVVIVLTLSSVYLSVLLNTWSQGFWDSLQNKDKAAFFPFLTKFCWLAGLFILQVMYSAYLTQLLSLRWRAWMTENLLGSWMREHTHFVSEITHLTGDNPDQRVSEDIIQFIDLSIELSISFLRNLLTLGSFIIILWQVSGPFLIPLPRGHELMIPGFMVWVALLYSTIGTWITHKVGKSLVVLDYAQQRQEADFRFGLMNFRVHSEKIALSRGERFARVYLINFFQGVYDNFYLIMKKKKDLNFTVSFYSQIANIFPILVSAPRLFEGSITLGGIQQIGGAFGRVEAAFSYFIQAYQSIASWRSVLQRLDGFVLGIEESQPLLNQARNLVKEISPTKPLVVRDLHLTLPSQETLFSSLNLQFIPQTYTLITGPSGIGKSTLFRAIAGIWPYYHQGTIERAPKEHMMIVTTKPYLPVGTLRDNLTFPALPKTIPDSDLKKALRDTQLEELIERLDEVQNWEQVLSSGEQQRVSFVRILLQKPLWLLLDEATSAVDEMSEKYLYDLIKKDLPEVTCVSISHRASTRIYHDQEIKLEA